MVLRQRPASPRWGRRRGAIVAFFRRRRIEQLLDDPYALGVGPDIADQEIMRQARR
ncbi:hypothetical protein [Frankia sp. Cr2]|uniref:hypothetical protein n=1 Tax=Frankia sp. Cr2 TaxID=3073932 RepID=UPI002AD45C7D|nr:hypothetical protein [Frankia sp. Cr2]